MYTEPILCLILLAGALALRTADRRRSHLIGGAALAALFLASWPPVSYLLSRPLEAWYDAGPSDSTGAEAIVVLSGAVIPAGPGIPRQMAGPDTYYRVMHSVWVHQKLKPLPILACGGQPGPSYTSSFARTMGDLLLQSGVPGNAIWLEERSSSTYENAKFAAGILRERGIGHIILVTHSHHMLRAERCFQRQGIRVTPEPFGFQHLSWETEALLPSWKGIRKMEQILHEEAGLVWYWLRGRI